jgi:hypothetical protein
MAVVGTVVASIIVPGFSILVALPAGAVTVLADVKKSREIVTIIGNAAA